MSGSDRHYDPTATAAALHARRERREPILALPVGVAPVSEVEAAAAQRALARLAGAEPVGGFKIGATARQMQHFLGVREPAAGFMAKDGLHAGGVVLRFADFIQPGVECELAVRLARDLPPGPCTRAEAADAVGTLLAGIEIVENRYDDFVRLGAPTLIADQFFHAAAVLGEAGKPDWRRLDIATLTGRISVDGALRGEGLAADLLGHPFNCLAWLAGSAVAAAFGGLRAGQVVMLGSVTLPAWLSEPAEVTVEFPPLPPVTLRLS